MQCIMQIGIKCVLIVHLLLQHGMALLCLSCFLLCSADAILGSGEFGLQPQCTLLRLLRCLKVAKLFLNLWKFGIP